jgi:hypothetical protein
MKLSEEEARESVKRSLKALNEDMVLRFLFLKEKGVL